jgi:predicted AAA+ superfamily ATPase
VSFTRSQAAVLSRRLRETWRFIQVVAGPRQVGKTTLVTQVVEASRIAARFASADEPTLRGRDWIEQQWQAARLEAGDAGKRGAVLVLDEIQKIQNWSETVKRLWDEDTRTKSPLKVVVLGSAPLLISRGLTESLAGRFELLHLPHWSYSEMQSAFGWNVERYLYYGGYPGSAPLIRDEQRWKRYILDSLIETTISRDVLLLSRVDKPAMLRRLFELGCRYSGQILSYTKMLGQLQDAGNSTTLAHYLDLLASAGMVSGLQKFAGEPVRQRGSSPKLQVFNTALVTAQSGYTLKEAASDHEYWGRVVESAVGAHLANAAAAGVCEVFYWRDRGVEVDFIVRSGHSVTAIEVKSGRTPYARSGLMAFGTAFKTQRKLLVGGDGITLEAFLSRPVQFWVKRD